MSKFIPSVCYKLNMILESPLSVGSGENTYTEHDVIVDGNNMPVIPATAIAGVFGSWLGEKKEELLGRIEREEEIDGEKRILEKIESKFRFYDAVCCDDKNSVLISTRDSVKLQNKIAVKGKKFDMQAVETGAKFCSYIELLDCKYSDELEKFFKAVNSGEIRFGSKTTRGYGQVSLTVFKAELNDVESWLSFKMFEDSSWFKANAVDIENINASGSADSICIKILMNCRSGILIRRYSTGVNMPDYETLSLGNSKRPVIPGTSWSGAFRSRFEEILGAEEANTFFGDVDEKNKNFAKSKILFSESIIYGGTDKSITRNAIDRFSGATKSGALYTEKTHYYGKTKLEIFINKKDIVEDKRKLKALAVCLADLHNGFLAVGGLTSIGRGLFEITDINGNENLLNDIIGNEVDIEGFVEEVLKNAAK